MYCKQNTLIFFVLKAFPLTNKALHGSLYFRLSERASRFGRDFTKQNRLQQINFLSRRHTRYLWQ